LLLIYLLTYSVVAQGEVCCACCRLFALILLELNENSPNYDTRRLTLPYSPAIVWVENLRVYIHIAPARRGSATGQLAVCHAVENFRVCIHIAPARRGSATGQLAVCRAVENLRVYIHVAPARRGSATGQLAVCRADSLCHL